ncbi:50s ribosomal subunit protein L28, putative [Theileria annulata]|uniref:50s ribosomal subunit protein L28, putative n=1 Tax=Theileria annulata TaxID=5874 RepID=Q4UF36_THEAN|nr:50s ribosomal subunit protein L28, putative [Theileria annulata]CAI74303.1 50s ribosomal subunit protein L28, putative [Theileria annulata]|eukprot:XP_952035.1 50s ribosomal subunit protein L28, putative [Theileria annulata]
MFLTSKCLISHFIVLFQIYRISSFKFPNNVNLYQNGIIGNIHEFILYSEKRHKEAMFGKKFHTKPKSSQVRHHRIVGRGGGVPRLNKRTKLPAKPIVLPYRRCMLLGKMDNTKAMQISHSGVKTRKTQKLNLHWKKIWHPLRKYFIRLRISMRGLKTIKRLGIVEAARRFHLNIDNPKDPEPTNETVTTNITRNIETGITGSKQDEGLRDLAGKLYSAANDLYINASGGDTDSPKKEAKDLKDAVGDKDQPGDPGKPKTLREALHQLGTAENDDPDLTDLAKAIKDKYSNFDGSGVKQKYNAVVAQKQAGKYGPGQGDTQYTQVEEAWNAFNNKYHDSISTDKFNITVIPSIFSIWKDLSPSTKYVYHGLNRTNNGFGGWTYYKDHQGNSNDHTAAAAEECKDSDLPSDGSKGTHVSVHAWIWHFLLYR